MSLSVMIKKELKGFSLDVTWEMGNELTVLFGYSGAGKSLTLQMIAGLMKPAEGIITLNEQTFFDSDTGADLTPQQRSLGYVFQHLALFPHMTVRNNILFGGGGLTPEDREEHCTALMAEFGLTGLERRFPSEISGGQRQRTAFARALIRRPSLLMLDEPFSALDIPLRREMGDFLKKIRNEFKIPVVMVTHDPVEALTLANRVIIYDGGKVVQSGRPDEVFDNPATQEVAQLVCNKLEGLF